MIDFPYILGLKNVIELIVSNFQEAVFVLDDNKVAVLLEDLMSKFQTFGEGLELLNEKVDKGFKELREEMNSRFDEVDKASNKTAKSTNSSCRWSRNSITKSR